MGRKKDRDFWIGLDLGGTKMLASLYGPDFKRIASAKKRTKGREGAEAGLQRIQALIRDVLAAGSVDAASLAGVGVACPGPLDLNKGIILEAPNLGWKQVPIRSVIEKQFACSAAILNDVDAGVYGEYRFGAGRKARCVLGVFPGTGIGGGCVYEGRLLRGRRTSCLELGHFPVVADGALCGCGRRGCLETVSSRLAIAAEAAKAAFRGEAPHLLSQGGTDLVNLRSNTLAASIMGGDAALEHIVRRAAFVLGRAIGGMVNLLAPDIVVLGGGLVEAMPDLYLEEAAKGAAETAMPAFDGQYAIRVAKLGDDAAVLGAAAWAEASMQAT